MVFSTTAREDVDNELLTKNITYRKYNNYVEDLATEEHEEENTYIDYSIKAQCTVQTAGSRFISEGLLLEGDLVGLFRYQYEVDSDGFVISPVLIPKPRDKIKFLNQWYVVKNCTPAKSEDVGVIGWDFTASQTGERVYELEEDRNCK
jgi:hypothetical protein